MIVLSQLTDLLYARHVVPHNPMEEKEREKENTMYAVPSLSDGAHEVAERFDHGAVISSRWRFNSNLPPPHPFPSTLLDGRRGISINCVGESPLFFFDFPSGAGMRCIRIIYYLQCTHMFRVRFVFPSER